MPPDEGSTAIEGTGVEVTQDTAVREPVVVTEGPEAVSEEKKPYSLSDAFDEASEEKKEKPAPKEEKKESAEGKQEEQKSEVKAAVPEIDKETEQAREFYRLATTDEGYQKLLYEQLQKKFQGSQKPVQAAQGPSEESKLDEILNTLDPDVRKALEGISRRQVAAMQAKLNEQIRVVQQEQAKQQARKQALTEYEDFSSSHKEEIAKYEKPMLELAKKYPDLLRDGKKGLDTLYRLASEEDRISARVAQEVEKALGRQKEVSEKVKRFSSSVNTPSTSHSVKGKAGYTLMDAFEDASKAKSVNV